MSSSPPITAHLEGRHEGGEDGVEDHEVEQRAAGGAGVGHGRLEAGRQHRHWKYLQDTMKNISCLHTWSRGGGQVGQVDGVQRVPGERRGSVFRAAERSS